MSQRDIETDGAGFVNLAELRGQLERGQLQAFGHALGMGVHLWREKYLPLHFQPTAYYRYGHPRAKYLAEHRSSKTAAQRGQGAVVFNGVSLRVPFSRKAVIQARAGMALTDNPLVLSGRTRAGFLGSSFRVKHWKRPSKFVAGSWFASGIAWGALSRKGGELGKALLFTNPQETGPIDRSIRASFDGNIAILNRGSALPTMPFGE